jgi:hypothetical protein
MAPLLSGFPTTLTVAISAYRRHPCLIVKPGSDGIGIGDTCIITENVFGRLSKIDPAKEHN